MQSMNYHISTQLAFQLESAINNEKLHAINNAAIVRQYQIFNGISFAQSANTTKLLGQGPSDHGANPASTVYFLYVLAQT